MRLNNIIMNTLTTEEYQQLKARLVIEDRNETQGLSCLIDSNASQSDYAKCYKPYRTLHNY